MSLKEQTTRALETLAQVAEMKEEMMEDLRAKNERLTKTINHIIAIHNEVLAALQEIERSIRFALEDGGES